tara:strand:- start:1550 stop:2029 length:480 start_codon:yes stop_codon:yes gene_type:complete
MGLAGAAFNNDYLARFWLPGFNKKELLTQMKHWSPLFELKTCGRFEKKVVRYFEGRAVVFDEAVSLGTMSGFYTSVYENLRKVERGKTVSYGELASLSGAPGAARAVGSAMAKNPIPLIIPCHRVVKCDGSLGNFSGPGGVEQKRRMLIIEQDLKGSVQ